MNYKRFALALALATMAGPVAAQEVWLQIEAQNTGNGAVASAQDYAERIDNVEAYDLNGSSWYAIVVGPFDEAEIAEQRRALRAQRLIPGDSFTNTGNSFGDRVWPEGDAPQVDLAQAEEDAPVASPNQDNPDFAEAAPETVPEPEPEPAPEPDETVAEARRSEAQLTREEKQQLQIALQWAGFYDGAIDAAFGRGTRGSMSFWQDENGYEPTGVLTTRQRADLIGQYNAVLDGLGLAEVTDSTAGITVSMPTELVAFDRYEPPFAHYEAVDGAEVDAKVLLISQRGQRADLYGLYDILQTLEIVPPEGERERRESGFTLIGRNGRIVSQTEARLENGEIKGFTLIWPANDEDRRTRLIDEMIASFDTMPGQVMPDLVGEPTEDQSVDLLSGLAIRKPKLVRSGFYVSRRGEVLTTSEAVAECSRITLDDDVEATVKASDDARGLALLEPGQALAPRQHATFLSGVPRLNSDVILSGYSFGGQLGAPSLTYGTLAAMTGLNEEDDIRRYDLASMEGDMGGPVFDTGGVVLGLLRDAPIEGRSLPEGVSFATDVATIRDFLVGAGVTPRTDRATEDLPQGQIERRAGDMTVLVGCWE
ncbi:hypothetical protein PARPLA_00974 [Rhodobacteraceae bacterium THAF1]|uniref:serine protease n=1 Tax=Palleronia sp. THAF1 TaxID=2587842 RepID=UPI000F3E13DD|nr:serine protease [Palleronia sp. THAF1]QFU07510.1 hypothetical protein FIU81_02345 [Palleronia sp. THAF1]VDC20473.1 hypothetical protein PARPLA_00974 [Rhodobacteraceae bacterium THAF1]